MKTIRNAIYSHYSNLFGSLPSVETILTQYDNQAFATPNPEDAQTDVWVRFSVLFGEAQATELGTNSGRFRHPGVAMAQVFGPVSKGDDRILAVAESIAENFRAVTVSGVTYRVPYFSQGIADGAWWMVTVTIPFFADLAP